MRVFKNGWFEKFARKQNIVDRALCEAVERAANGMIDADLGGGRLKQRVARSGAGKSGGYRTLIFSRAEMRAVFAFGFAKSDQANLSGNEAELFKKAAKLVLSFSDEQMDAEVASGRLKEVICDGENLQK